MLFTFVIRKWQERRDSNPQPPVLETGALPLSYAPADWDGASGNRIAIGTQPLVQLMLAARHYNGMKLERVMGIEPTQPAWKAGTLPLSYTRL